MSINVDIQVLEMRLEEWGKHKRKMRVANLLAGGTLGTVVVWSAIASSMDAGFFAVLALISYAVAAASIHMGAERRILGAYSEVDTRAKLLRKREALYRSMTVGDEPESYWDYPSPPIQMWNPKN